MVTFLTETHSVHPGHQQEWLHLIKNGTPTASPFGYPGSLTEANHLGKIAFSTGKKLAGESK